MTYTLTYSNPTSSLISGAAVTDTLPPAAGMEYVSGSASGGGVFNSGSNTLSWTIPSVPPGVSVSLTYQLKVTTFAGAFNPVTNNAQITFPGGTASASNAISVTGDYTVRVSVYNGAGEVIKVLKLFESSAAISNFDLTGSPITSAQGMVTLLYHGSPLTAWDATNSNGNKVANGTYLIKVDSVDRMGVETSITRNVMVSIIQSTLEITVYNSVGERVRSFTQAEIENILSATGGLQPLDFEVGRIVVSPGVFMPSYSSSGSNNYISISLGSGQSIQWDGRNDSGVIVSNGNYFIEVKSIIPDQGSQELIREVKVVNNGETAAAGIVLAPNPISLRIDNQAQFLLNGLSPEVVESRARIYTIAGELIKILVNDPGNPAVITWDLSSPLASGTYLAVVEMNSPSGGLVGRKIMKVVIFH